MGSKFLTDLSDGRYVVKLPRHLGGFFRNEADHRDFVAVGMAAGAARPARMPVQPRMTDKWTKSLGLQHVPKLRSPNHGHSWPDPRC